MSDTTAIHDIIRLTVDVKKYSIGLQVNWLISLTVIVIFFVGFLLFKVIKRNRNLVKTEMEPVELKINFGGGEVKYNIERNYENLEIAHRLYIELITRKAALPIDEKNDIIVEVYNSWYTLFQVTRDELKKIPGKLLFKNASTSKLEELATAVLNNGLRPHLTEYQGRFRKWYDEELKDPVNKTKSPQQIQETFVDYVDLIASMKKVNDVLKDYSGELGRLING